MKVEDLKIGNIIHFPFISNDVEIIGINAYETNDGIEHKLSCREGINLYCEPITVFKPIPITNDILLRVGFKDMPHFTIGNSKVIDLGRGRILSISDVGNPNLMAWLISEDGKKRTDLICVHNWDYNKELYLHQLQNLHFSLTGNSLTLKPQSNER